MAKATVELIPLYKTMISRIIMNRFLWVCSDKECSVMKYNELEAKNHKHFMIKCSLVENMKKKKSLKNIFRCIVCGRSGMFEEEDLHECRALKDYKFEEDVIRVFDGKSWYPLNLVKVQKNVANGTNKENKFFHE